MRETKTLDLTRVSLTFPDLPEPLVSRAHLVKWLRDSFSPDRKVIIVKGLDGSGKTTLLAQFAQAHADRSFCFFIKPDQYIATAKPFFRELCGQMQTVLHGTDEVKDDYYELKQQFGDLLFKIAKQARRVGHAYYFVIDGLEWATEHHDRESLIDLLPTGSYRDIYLLGSAGKEQELPFEHETRESVFFSEPEAREYFRRAGLSINEQTIRKIYDVCDGMPGYLDQVRREVQDQNKSISQVIDNLPNGFRALLERDWARTNVGDQTILDVLAIVAHARASLSLSAVAEIVSTRKEMLQTMLCDMSILRCSAEEIHFVTDAHGRFFADKFNEQRGWAEEALINYYSKYPFEQQSLEQLPLLLKEANSYDRLQDLVTSDYLVRTLEEQQDLFLLRRNVQLVSGEAQAQKDWQVLSKYSLLSNILTTLSREPVIKAEVDALLSIDEYTESLQLANQALLPEDRLQLLARIGSRMKQKGELLPGPLSESLEQLVLEVNPAENTSKRIAKIAADLFYVHYQAATDLMNRVTGTSITGRSADVLMALLSSRLEGDAADYAESLKSQISNKTLRDFARAHSKVVSSFSAAQVLKELEKVEEMSFKLLLLRSWCNSNRDDPEAFQVVEQALELMTAATTTPSMRHLRQFAEPLLAQPQAGIFDLIERFDLLKAAAINRPAEEAIRLEMLLAAVEARNGEDDRFITRVYKAYYDLEEIPEIDTRCHGLVRILIGLSDITSENSHVLEIIERHLTSELRQEIEDRLHSEYVQLINSSAGQLSLTRRIFRPLANYKPQMALRFAEMLNTLRRRDAAYSIVSSAYADRDVDSLDLNFIDNVLEKITEPSLRDWSFVELLETFAVNDVRRYLPERRIPQLRSLLDKIRDIEDPHAQCLANAYALRMHVSLDEKAVSAYYDDMRETWSKIDKAWERVQSGFALATTLGESAPNLARKLIELARDERASSPLAEAVFSEVYINTLKLAIRMVPDIVKGSEQEYQTARREFTEAIRNIPGQSVQCLLFAELAMRLHSAGQLNDFNSLVNDNILSCLRACTDEKARVQAVVNIAPCLYEYERTVLAEEISRLSSQARDRALANVIHYLLSKRPIGDPIDIDSLNVELDYRTALGVCEILDQMSTDTAIFIYFDRLVDLLIRKVKQSHHTMEKCTIDEKSALAIAKKLVRLIEAKFPDPKNIQHKGYKVIARASVARLRASAERRAGFKWEKLVPSWKAIDSEARQIPNLADRVYVMGLVGERMYWSEMKLAHQLIEDAKDIIHDIPNTIDRGRRLNSIAEVWVEVDDTTSARALLKEALTILREWELDSTRDELTGSILELAHRIEPEFAASLTDTLDNPLQKHDMEHNLLVRDLKEKPRTATKRGAESRDVHRLYGDLGLELLRSLCSGKGQILPEDYAINWTYGLVEAPVQNTYPLLAWSIENEIARTRKLSVPTMTDLYNGLIDSLETTLALSNMLSGLVEHRWEQRQKAPLPPNLQLFSVGSEEEALRNLRDWLAENVEGYLKIYDPYFTSSELEIIRYVPFNTRVTILTSWKAQSGIAVGDTETLERIYRDTWKEISDQEPPPTRIYVFGIGSGDHAGDSPLHQRYFITVNGRALEMGTSQSGLGRKDTSLRQMEADEAFSIEREVVDNMILSPPPYYRNERLMSSVFDL